MEGDMEKADAKAAVTISIHTLRMEGDTERTQCPL